MSQLKIRTRIVTAAAALTLWPALALAQGDSTSAPSQGSQGQSPSTSSQSAHPGASGQTPSTSATEDSDTGASGAASGSSSSGTSSSSSAQRGNMTSQSQNAMPSAPSASGIDPAEVQKVFGTDVSLIELSSLDSEQIRQLQQQLQQRGHYRGAIDGIVGPKTRSALTALLAEQYSLNQRLVNQGQITEQLATSMGIDAEGRTPVRGVDMSGLPNQNQQQRSNVQSFPPSNGSQSGSAPSNGQRGASPSSPPPSPSPSDDGTSVPDDSRTDDGRSDNYAPVAPK